MVWLHGTLYLNILEARNLANDTNISLGSKHLPGRMGSGDGTKFGRMFAKAAKATEGAIGEALNRCPSVTTFRYHRPHACSGSHTATAPAVALLDASRRAQGTSVLMYAVLVEEANSKAVTATLLESCLPRC